MHNPSTVTDWIAELKAGSPAAAQKIWERYAQSLITLAHRKLARTGGQAVDGDDIVQQAFAAFFRAVQAGRLPRLSDRNDLWAMLVKIAENKVVDQRRRAGTEKRGGDLRGTSLRGLGDPEPPPDVVAEAIDQYEHLLSLLPDEPMRRIARLKMEGYSQDEIARQLDCVRETVNRKLRLIRTIWSKEIQQ